MCKDFVEKYFEIVVCFVCVSFDFFVDYNVYKVEWIVDFELVKKIVWLIGVDFRDVFELLVGLIFLES